MSRWKRLPGNVSLCILGVLVMTSSAQAQIQGDGTLNTQVNGNLTVPCTGTCIVTDGTARGGNLFHSFRQFSLPNGDFAGFVTTPAIQNVLVRVTGVGQPFSSNINGTIATSNPANFFLLNPNGIVFGSGTQLLIGGSFLATTANRMVFQDGTAFDTRDPAPLLTISVPVGLQFGQSPGSIQMNGSRLQAGQSDDFTSFALVGGNVTLDNSNVLAPGQRIELAGIGGNGAVGLQLNGDRLSLSPVPGTPRQDITLTNGSIVNVVAQGGGDIAVTASSILLDHSNLVAGILGIASERGGDITLNATESINLTGGIIANPLLGIGNTGDIDVTAKSLTFKEGGRIDTAKVGIGVGGNINIQASDTVTADRLNPNTGSSGCTGIVICSDSFGVGKSGDIQITTGSLRFTNGAEITASATGIGIAGNVSIQAHGAVSFDGIDSTSAGGILSQLKDGLGKGGNVQIKTDGTFTLTNGAVISTSTNGVGDAGNVMIQGNAVSLGGRNTSFPSTIFTGVGQSGRGNGGNVQISTGSLTLANGGLISTSSTGVGNSGDVIIHASDAVLLTGSGFIPSTGSFLSTILTNTFNRGNSGNIEITAGSLTLDKDNLISSSAVLGEGNSGKISIGVQKTISLNGGAIFTVPGFLGGQGGDIQISTGSLLITNGGSLSANTLGFGNAGNITIHAGDRVFLDNGRISNGNFGVRDLFRVTGVSVQIDPNLLKLFTSSSASAGDITVSAPLIWLDHGSSIETKSASGNGGNIQLQAQKLLVLRHNSVISTEAGVINSTVGNFGFPGTGGNLTINTPFIVSAPLENSDIIANAFSDSGGRLTINAQGIYWMTFRTRADLQRLLGTSDPFQLDPQRLSTNDITSFSQSRSDLPDQVFLNTPDVDPSRGLTQLPTNLVDPTNQIDQRCVPKGTQQASSFTVTGRGGLASSPTEPLMQQGALIALVKLPEGELEKQSGSGLRVDETDKADRSSVTQAAVHEIVEAKGWIVDAKGNVQLVADASTERPSSLAMRSLSCVQR